MAITELEFRQKRKFGDDYETLAAPAAQTSSGADTAANLVDDDPLTAWVSDPAADGVGQTATLTFAKPVDIDRIRIAPGRAKDDFEASPRPKDLQLAFTCQTACEPTKQVSLPDKSGFRTVAFTARGVTKIVVQVRSVNGAGGGVAISEIQVQRKRPKLN